MLYRLKKYIYIELAAIAFHRHPTGTRIRFAPSDEFVGLPGFYAYLYRWGCIRTDSWSKSCQFWFAGGDDILMKKKWRVSCILYEYIKRYKYYRFKIKNINVLIQFNQVHINKSIKI